VNFRAHRDTYSEQVVLISSFFQRL